MRTSSRTAAFSAAFAVATLSAASAGAAAIYNYTGNGFASFSTNDPPGGADSANIPGSYSSANFVRGYFEVAAPLAATGSRVDITGLLLDFSFTAGRNPALDLANAGLAVFNVQADAMGDITSWDIVLRPKAFSDLQTGEGGYSVQTNFFADLANTDLCTFNGGGGCSRFISEHGSVGNPGAWTQTGAAVPLPASGGLLAAALAFLSFRRRQPG